MREQNRSRWHQLVSTLALTLVVCTLIAQPLAATGLQSESTISSGETFQSSVSELGIATLTDTATQSVEKVTAEGTHNVEETASVQGDIERTGQEGENSSETPREENELPSRNGSAVLDPALQAETSENTGQITVLVALEPASVPETASAKATIKRLKTQAEQTQPPVIEQIERLQNATVESTFWLTNAIAVTTTPEQLDQIADIPGVQGVYENKKRAIPEPIGTFANGATDGAKAQASVTPDGNYTYGLEQINAPETYEQFENDGDGVRVAVLDTGVDPNHTNIEIEQENFATFAWNGSAIEDAEIRDAFGHGTHVSGTVVGGVTEDGTQIGVAPNATLMHGRVLTGFFTSPSQVIGGMEWAVENDADVISMSLGFDSPVFTDAVNNAVDSGTVVVASIGNDGPGTGGAPGVEYPTFAIGASNEAGNITGFSSGKEVRAFETFGKNVSPHYPDRYLTPDYAAPGELVYSSVPTYFDGDNYRAWNGTSMAAPHVAGSIAVALSNVDREMSHDELYNIIAATTNKPDYAPNQQDIRYGHGIIDLQAMTEAAVADNMSVLTGTVTDTNTSKPIPGTTVKIAETGEQAVVNPDGSYELPTIANGTVTVVANAHPQTTKRTTTIDSQQQQLNFTLDARTTEFYINVTEDVPTLAKGVEYTIPANVTGWGGSEATKSVELYVDGEKRDSQSLTVGDRETKETDLSFVPEQSTLSGADIEIRTGDHSASVEDVLIVPAVAGEGTESNPYRITEFKEIYALAANNIGQDRDSPPQFEITADLQGPSDALPAVPRFKGSLDGNGHTISDVTIAKEGATVKPRGLINTLNGTVQNLQLQNITIEAEDENLVGGLAGKMTGENALRNVTISGNVTGDEGVGGLVGYVESAESTIYNASATVTVSGILYIGGLAGATEGEIHNSSATATVSGSYYTGGLSGSSRNTVYNGAVTGNISGYMQVGGLIGESIAPIYNSSANVTVSGSDEVGGLVGKSTVLDENESAENAIYNSSANATVSGRWNVGGFAGNSRNAIYNSSAQATVKGIDIVGGFVGVTAETVRNSSVTAVINGRDHVGGFVGRYFQPISQLSHTTNYTVGTINDSSANATVSGESVVGGFAGSAERPMSNASATATVNGNRTIGGFVGENEGQINGSTATATVNGTDDVGGFAGGNSGTLSQTNAVGTVNGTNRTGGFVGMNGGQIQDSTAAATVNGTRDVGGFAGGNSGTLTQTSAVGTVNGTNRIGGLVGTNDETIDAASADGLVTSSHGQNIGGLVGKNTADITNATASTAVRVTAATNVGGLVGGNLGTDGAPNATIKNSYATGNLTGTGTRAGSLVGLNDVEDAWAKIQSSYAIGTVELTNQSGGLLGANDSDEGVVTDSYWDINTTGQTSSVAGTGLQTSQMTGSVASEYMDLAFGDIWQETATYPALAWETTGSVTMADQWTVGESVTVESAQYHDPYVIVIHQESQTNNETLGTALGTSQPFEGGQRVTEIEVALDQSLEENTTVTAALHHVANDTAGELITADGSPVSQTAAIELGDVGVTQLETDTAGLTDNAGASAVAGVDTLTANATVKNAGDDTVTKDVTLTFGDQTLDTKSVTLDPGTTKTVSFVFTAPETDTVSDGSGAYEYGVSVGEHTTTTSVELLPAVTLGDQPARDTNGDGLLNDINGDGSFDIFDVQALFEQLETIDENAQYFDFDSNQPPAVDIFDVQALFEQVTAA